MRVLRLLASALLLAGVVVYVSLAGLFEAFATADVHWIAAAAALVPAGVVLQWLKWRALLRCVAPEVGERDVVRSLLAGFGLGLVTPGRLGEIGRGLAVPGVGRSATVLAAADRLLSSVVTVGLGALAATLAWPGRWPLALAAVMALVAGALLALGQRLARRRWVADLRAVLVLVSWRAWSLCAGASLLFNFVFFAQLFLLVRAAGEVPAAAALAIPVVFALKALAPVSFLDLGVREGAAVGVLGAFGVGAGAALQAALLLMALNVLLPGVAGLLVLGDWRKRDPSAGRVARSPV